MEPRGKQPPHPERSELAPLSSAALVERYAVGVENFDRRVLSLTDEQLDTAFRPEAKVGLWSARVLVGHCADGELSFVQRMRRIKAEDGPTLEAWDENAFIDSGLYGRPGASTDFKVAAFIAAIHSLRMWTAEWLRTLDEPVFARRGLHTQRGPMTLRDILEYSTWHIENHAWFLNRKLDLLLGPARTP